MLNYLRFLEFAFSNGLYKNKKISHKSYLTLEKRNDSTVLTSNQQHYSLAFSAGRLISMLFQDLLIELLGYYGSN